MLIIFVKAWDGGLTALAGFSVKNASYFGRHPLVFRLTGLAQIEVRCSCLPTC